MPVIWNPTNEDFDTIFEGIPCKIQGVNEEHPKGQMIRVEKARAGHLMNVYEKRGLAQLEYGDENSGMEEKKQVAALERNQSFKEKQIMDYNTDNERRKQSGEAYVKPTDQVAKYAAEIGIELLKPYAQVTQETKRVADLEEDNKTLRDQMASMMDKMNTMMETIAGGGKVEIPADKTKDEITDDTRKRKFNTLGKDRFKKWLINNKGEVQAWNHELQDSVRDRWRSFFPEEECLLDAAA